MIAILGALKLALHLWVNGRYFISGMSCNCMVVIGDRAERLHQLFEDVQYVTTSAPNPYAQEAELGIFICRRARFGSTQKIWPQIKRWR